MEISSTKSTLIAPGGIIDERIRDFFPYLVTSLDDGFKYLGYSLKSDKYRKKDWLWLWERLDRKMGLWCYRFLSLGGRLIPAKAVLESIPVYWLSLFKIPISILEGIRRRITSFLWSGSGRDDKIHLVHWSCLARPKHSGGWGLRRLDPFSKALRMKSLWRGLFSKTLWNKILIYKYIRK